MYFVLSNLPRYEIDLSLMIGLPSGLYGAEMMHAAVEFVVLLLFLERTQLIFVR